MPELPKIVHDTRSDHNLEDRPVHQYIGIDTHDLYQTPGGLVRWSNKKVLPSKGDKVTITMNKIGPGIVAGYFVESGFLGIWVKPDNPPDWYVKQNHHKNHTGPAASWHNGGYAGVFGAEVEF